MKRKNSRGIALLMVLWVLMLLSVIVGEFCFAMRTRVNITRNFKESTQAYYIAIAGFNKAVEQIIRLETAPQQAATVDAGVKDAENDGNKMADPMNWRVNMDLPPVDFGAGTYEVRIENESGRINLNLADGNLLRAMLGGLDLDNEQKDVIVDSIMDWRDKDSSRRLNGAEEDYYQSLPHPYHCKNADFDAREELMLVRGVTSAIYQRIAPMVTVFPKSDTEKLRQFGSKNEFDYNHLNINAIPLELWAVFPGMTPDLVAAVAAFRAENDFVSLEELINIVGADVYRGMAIYLTLDISPYFIIRSRGRVADSRIVEGVTAEIVYDISEKTGYRMVQWVDDVNRNQVSPDASAL